MGLSYLAFACSIDAFASVYASRDEALWESLVTSTDRNIRHYLKLDLPATSHPLEAPDHLKPLREIFVGAAYFRHPPHHYAYAHLACAYALGTSLGESQGSYGRSSRLDVALSALGEPSDPLGLYESSDWPLPGLPPLADWPQYWAFSAVEVARRAAILEGVVRRTEAARAASEGESSWELLSEGAGFYAECAARGSDLIMVAH